MSETKDSGTYRGFTFSIQTGMLLVHGSVYKGDRKKGWLDASGSSPEEVRRKLQNNVDRHLFYVSCNQ